MRRITALVARALAALVLLVGVPAALIVGVGVPSRLPTGLEVRSALEGSGDQFDTALVWLVSGVIWVVWLQLAVAVVAAVASRRRGVPPRRLRLVPRGIQVLALHLVSSITLVVVPAPAATSSAVPPAVAPPADPFDVGGVDVVAGPASTPWSVAEEYLGDGRRWREVAELNPELAEEIPDGERVVVPGSEHVVGPGESFWTIAEAIAGDREVVDVWLALVDANVDRLVDPDDPDLIHPGLVLRLPGVRGPLEHRPPVIPGVAARDTGPVEVRPPVLEPPATGPDAPEVAPPVLHPGVVEQSGLGIVLTGRFGPGGRLGDAAAGASAAALGYSLYRLGRRGRTAPEAAVPDDRVVPRDRSSERSKRRSAGPTAPEVFDAACVVRGLRSHGLDVFAVALGERVSALLGAPCLEAPPGVEVTDGGWSLDIGDRARQRFREAGPGDTPPPVVALGDHPVGGRLVVDLSRLGHLRLRGSHDEVCAVADAIVTDARALGTPVSRIQPAIPGRTLSDRLERDEGGLVVDVITDDPTALDRLDGRDDLVAVTANGRAEWVAEVAGPDLVLEPLGIVLAREPARPAPRVATTVKPDGVQLKVMGPVVAVGAAREFTSRVALDLVAYLAFHPEGADGDSLRRWVWPPDDPPGDRAFANTLWRARRTLGQGPDGRDLLPRVGADRRYRLSPLVTTDFAVATAHIDEAHGADPATARRHLRVALDLVRGAPFAGAGSDWADHGVRAHVEFVLDDAAHRLADLALEAGDVGLARWACRQGLLVVPGCVQCQRRRLLVATAAANPSELRSTMAEIQRIAESEGERVDEGLVDLYRDLLGDGSTSAELPRGA